MSHTPVGTDLAAEAFKTATNMTDQMGALRLLCDIAGPEREAALEAFYQQWQGEMLCVTKWLTMQSACELEGNAAAVEKLLSHPAFDLRSPNKCYAVVRAFTRRVFPSLSPTALANEPVARNKAPKSTARTLDTRHSILCPGRPCINRKQHVF